MGTLLESPEQSSGFKGITLIKEKSPYEKLHLYRSDTPFSSFKNRILQLLRVLFKHSHVTINKTSFTCANVIYKIKYSQNSWRCSIPHTPQPNIGVLRAARNHSNFVHAGPTISQKSYSPTFRTADHVPPDLLQRCLIFCLIICQYFQEISRTRENVKTD